MRAGFFLCTTLLATCALWAQTTPDFTGVYLLDPAERPQTETKPRKGRAPRSDPRLLAVQQIEETLVAGSSLILVIRQSEGSLYATWRQNGATSMSRFDLNGQTTENRTPWGLVTRDRAKFRKQKLIIESVAEGSYLDGPTMQGIGLTVAPRVNGVRFKETWELKPNQHTLVIESLYSLASYSRQPSSEAALAKADAASLMKRCSSLKWPPLQEDDLKYGGGVTLGITAYRQLARCVSFEANLLGECLGGLERTVKSGVAEFRKNGSVESEYPDSVVLEIQPRVWYWPADGLWWVPRQAGAAKLPDEYLDLRFRIAWAGLVSRDLGEVNSELITEPWPELRPPQRFYRLKIPSNGIPLTDTLEIQIFSSDGESVGCISGHI